MSNYSLFFCWSSNLTLSFLDVRQSHKQKHYRKYNDSNIGETAWRVRPCQECSPNRKAKMTPRPQEDTDILFSPVFCYALQASSALRFSCKNLHTRLLLCLKRTFLQALCFALSKNRFGRIWDSRTGRFSSQKWCSASLKFNNKWTWISEDLDGSIPFFRTHFIRYTTNGSIYYI